MAGRGPAPKPAELRQRANPRMPGRRLPTEEQSASREVPGLPSRPDGGWHPMVEEWWAGAWRSPMASEWLDSDMHGGLYLLADLYEARWLARDDPKELRELSKEIRTLSAEFGLTPMTRRRLQWEVEKGEQAAERTETRRKTKTPARKPRPDHRSVLKIA